MTIATMLTLLMITIALIFVFWPVLIFDLLQAITVLFTHGLMLAIFITVITLYSSIFASTLPIAILLIITDCL